METHHFEFTEVNLKTFKGTMPSGTDLVVMEKGDEDSALVLYGFDEVGLYDHTFKNPVYGFMRF